MRYLQSLFTLIGLALATAPCRADTLFGFDIGAAPGNQDYSSVLLGALGVVALLMVLVCWKPSMPRT